jgi:hypothetical protein
VIVGTWNLENLFRPGADAGPSDEQSYDAKLTELARVIREIVPDILAVQEVGDPGALEDLGGVWTATGSPRAPNCPTVAASESVSCSRVALGDVEQVGEFPDGLEPVQVDDQGTTMAEMGRGGCGFAFAPAAGMSTWSAAT